MSEEKRIVFVDLEIGKKDERIYKIGAIKVTVYYDESGKIKKYDEGEKFKRELPKDLEKYSLEKKKLLENFYKFVDDFDTKYICGHNIILFDSKYIENDAYKDKYIDTLILSPFLRPEYPYHKIEKDYKAEMNDKNDPVQDSKKCYELLKDEIERYKKINEEDKDALDIIAALISREDSSFKPDDSKKQRSDVHPKEIQKQIANFFELVNYKISKEYIDVNGNINNDILAREILNTFEGRICSSKKTKEKLKGYIAQKPMALGYFLSNVFINKKTDAAMGTSDDHHLSLPAFVERHCSGIDQINWDLCGTNCHGCEYCRRTFDYKKQVYDFIPEGEFKGFKKFKDEGSERALQEQGIKLALENKNIFVVFPTGGGKSLTFQLPAVMQWRQMGALTVVISPLQSLMNNQVAEMEDNNIMGSFETINGSQSNNEKSNSFKDVESGVASILYISPEILRSRKIYNLLRNRMIARFVIDEAHCFSRWGNEFRPDYQYIAKFIDKLKKDKGLDNISVSCFTATANENVRNDIQKYFETYEINLENCITNSQRENLNYYIEEINVEIKDSDSKKKIKEKIQATKITRLKEKLKDILEKEQGKEYGIIIFAAFTSATEVIADEINKTFSGEDIEAGFFHGQMRDKKEKKGNQDWFIGKQEKNITLTDDDKTGKAPKVRVMVATSAFGMGVNKKDVRYVIHFDISQSFEDYIQEAGRAGRDNEPADCILFYTKGDYDLDNNIFLQRQSRFSFDDVKRVWNYLSGLADKKIKSGIKDKEISIFSNSKAIAARKNSGVNYENVPAIIQLLENKGYLTREEDVVRVFPFSREYKPKLAERGEVEKEWAEQIYNYLKEHDYDESGIELLDLRNETATQIEEDKKEDKDFLEKFMKVKNGGMKWFINLLNDMCVENAIDIDSQTIINAKKTEIKDEFEKIKELEKKMFKKLDGDSKEGIYDYNYSTEEYKDENKKHIVNILSAWNNAKFVKPRYYIIKTMITLSGNSDEYKFRVKDLCDEIEKRNKICDKIIEQIEGKDVLDKEEIKKAMVGDTITLKDVRNALSFLSSLKLIEVLDETIVFNRTIKMTIDREKIEKSFAEKDFKEMEEYYDRKDYQIEILKKFTEELRNDNSSNSLKAKEMVRSYLTWSLDVFLKKYGLTDIVTWKNRRKLERECQLKKKLNDEQLKVINDKESRIIYIAAGPGSGKTKVIVEKTVSLIEDDGYKPEDIIMLSFTNATNDELRARIIEEIGINANKIVFRTFHSFAASVLNEVGRYGYDMYDDVGYDQMLKDCDTELQKIKNEINNSKKNEYEGIAFNKKVLVLDEAQDLNKYMYSIVANIMYLNYVSEADYLKIIVAADPDQLIMDYNRRCHDSDESENFKANIEHLKKLIKLDKSGELRDERGTLKAWEMGKEHTDFKKYELIKNYRSSDNIVKCFERFRENKLNSKDIWKREGCMQAINEKKGRVSLYESAPDKVYSLMKKIIDNDIENYMHEKRSKNSLSIGVLFETNDEVVSFQDVMKKTWEKADINVLTLGSDQGNYFKIKQLDEFHVLLRRMDPIALENNGFLTENEIKKQLDSLKKAYGKSIYINAVQNFIEKFINNSKGASGLIHYNELVSRLDEVTFDEFIKDFYESTNSDDYVREDDKKNDYIEIKISTIHKAKGREFDWVYLYTPRVKNEKGIEIFDNLNNMRYVAMSRAKSRLCIFDKNKDSLREYDRDLQYYEEKKSTEDFNSCIDVVCEGNDIACKNIEFTPKDIYLGVSMEKIETNRGFEFLEDSNDFAGDELDYDCEKCDDRSEGWKYVFYRKGEINDKVKLAEASQRDRGNKEKPSSGYKKMIEFEEQGGLKEVIIKAVYIKCEKEKTNKTFKIERFALPECRFKKNHLNDKKKQE